jgi:hypothetical protein
LATTRKPSPAPDVLDRRILVAVDQREWVASPRTLSYAAASIRTRSVQLGVPHSQRISSFSVPRSRLIEAIPSLTSR